MTIDTDCTEPAPSAGKKPSSNDICDDQLHELSHALRKRDREEGLTTDEVVVCHLAEGLLSARSRIAELESRQPQSAEWVPWKKLDVVPAPGFYVCASEHQPYFVTIPRRFEMHGVIAYWPQPLPDPYTDAQGKRLPEREECEK